MFESTFQELSHNIKCKSKRKEKCWITISKSSSQVDSCTVSTNVLMNWTCDISEPRGPKTAGAVLHYHNLNFQD